MSQDRAMDNNRNQSLGTSPGAEQQYWASDDVHRLAMRRPALYQTNAVPQIERTMDYDTFNRGDESYD